MATETPTYVRTGTGYKRAGDEQERRCIRFYLNDQERKAFLRKRAEGGFTDNTTFLVDALELSQDGGEA